MENKKFLIIGGGVVLLIILGALFAFSSCKKKSTTQTGPNTLTVWNLYDDKDAFDQLIKDFQGSHKDLKIQYVKKDPQEYLTEALNKIAAGVGPDVWAIPNDWMPQYHDKLIPMPDGKMANQKEKKSDVEVYKETYPGVVVSDNIIEDKIYGAPMAIDTLALYYNTDIFGDVLADYQKTHAGEDTSAVRSILASGPKNWDEFVQAVKLVTKKSGGNIDQAAVALGTPDNVNQSVDILTMLMLQNGAQMTSDDKTTAQFHTQQNKFGGADFPGTKALEFYASFANPDNENYTWNSSMPDSLHAFAQGKTAMMIDYYSQKEEVKKINGQARFDVVAVPQIRETKNPVNYASYLTFTVTKASKKSDLAWDFINFITSRNSVNQYKAITKKNSARLDYITNSLDVVSEGAKTAQSWYKPDPDKADPIFRDMIKQVNDNKNAQTAIENAASQITTLLEKLKQ